MNRRRALQRLAAPPAAGLAACSPLAVVNGLSPAEGYRLQAGIAYGEGERRRLDLYAPEAGRAPALVVFFYGGSWRSGRREDYRFVGQALSALGFAVAIADYRLYPEVVFPGFVEDSAAAVAWALAHAGDAGVPSRRVFVMGHSAGAYNAAMVALAGKYLAAEGADPRQLAGLIGLAGPYDFLPLGGPLLQQIFGGAPDLAATQPVNFVTPKAPPALLATGDADTTVLPRNTKRLAARLREAGVPVQEKIYPDVDHYRLIGAVSEPLRHLAPVAGDVDSFVRRQSALAQEQARHA
ncbi:MAG TPA: alpha/beta hydrolase [Pelomicrobium sp.]|nr:alpha/beta hydrolase [Pelomicrobium sp.]